ncbi:uncharacterized protein LOC122250113 [Penaeus japonicus]|uniref:uncharacterized protein LOC122250113 n=1 Tax=Penaeus japonicus TaxID=27405 RepID=UPI001C70F601|nr:uncharacterized protein LOC122250113 [Penaeus japonicus]
MSDYPTQDAFYGAIGSGDEYASASLVFGDTQSSNVYEDEEYIANFDLDLLAAELWPESSVAGEASQSACSEGGNFGATCLFPQEDDFLGLGAVNPDDLFNSGSQPSYPSSSNTEEHVPYQYCNQQASSSFYYQPQFDLPQSENLSESFQQLSVFQSHDQFSGYPDNYGQQMGFYQYPDQQPGLSHGCNQKGSVVFQNEKEPPVACPSGSGTSKKRKGYRHRHQRQFLSSDEERKQRSRKLNNEASAIYRERMSSLHEKARMELDSLEQRNQQLTQRFRLLQKFCSGYKTHLEALGVLVTNSF